MIAEVEAFAAALGGAGRASRNTVIGYRRDLMDFRSFLLERGWAVEGGERVNPDAVTDDHVRSYLAEMLKRATRSTVQRRLFALKAFFRYREAAIGVASPARMIRSPRTERRLPIVLGEEEVGRLIDVEARPGQESKPATLRNLAIVEVLYSTGMRVSELTAINWRNIDEELGMIMIESGKGGKGRIIPLGEPALDALARLAPRDAGSVVARRARYHQSARWTPVGSRRPEYRRAPPDRGRCRHRGQSAWLAPLLRHSYAEPWR